MAQGWHNIICVKSGLTSGDMYVNGAIQSQYTGNFTNNSAPFLVLHLGAYASASPVLFLNGLIDEVRVYNRTLTSDEIKQLYRMGKTIFQNR